MVWDVREADARDVPGARGPRCLIFESPEVVRRVWVFPANWRELDDDALWRYSEQTPLLNAQAEARRRELDSAVQRAMESINAAQALVARMKAAVEVNS